LVVRRRYVLYLYEHHGSSKEQSQHKQNIQ
jgi:hypothetical protein